MSRHPYLRCHLITVLKMSRGFATIPQQIRALTRLNQAFWRVIMGINRWRTVGPTERREGFILKKLLALLIIMLCAGLSCAPAALACTIFSLHRGGEALVGNNEDWHYNYASTGWVARGGEGEYGRVCFSNAGYVQGGMNEKGLFYDGATCPGMKPGSNPNKETLSWTMGEQLLIYCASVDEAIAYLEARNAPPGFEDHLLLADADGSAVIEWIGGELHAVRPDADHQIATNFALSAPELGGYPCPRYSAIEKAMQSGDPVDPAALLRQTAQSWNGGGTKYSNIYNLIRLSVTSYAKADYTKPYTIDLMSVLSTLEPGERITFDVDEQCAK